MLVTPLIWWGCAQSGSLSGGPRDTEPPVLDSIQSTPKIVLNYSGDPIHLEFNEFIEVKDPRAISISPPTRYFPSVRVRGKRLVFQFKEQEELKENITYRIDFDEAVVDYTEGNAIGELTYLLSTGDDVDSLELKGNIRTTSGDIPDEVILMLYDKLQDSIVTQELPLYYTKIEEEGAFHLEYLRDGGYKVVALKDNNANYLYDLKSEWIGFVEGPVVLADTALGPFDIILFQGDQDTVITDLVSNQYGRVNVTFNYPPEQIDLVTENIKMYPIQNEDNLTLWYNDTIKEAQFILNGDTSRIKIPKIDSSTLMKPVKFKSLTQAKYFPDERITMEFDRPLASVEPEKLLLEGSPALACREFQVALNTVSFKCDSLEAKNELKMMPGFVQDIYGNTIDTSLTRILTVDTAEIISIPIEIIGLSQKERYILTLISEGNAIDTTTVLGDTLITKTYTNLKPGSHTLNIVEDVDSNGKWSTGDYWTKKLPERKVSLGLPVISEAEEYLKIDWRKPEGRMVEKISPAADEEENIEE